MTVIAVVNPKGGVGKTTLATNLAGYFANTNASIMLGDVDKQQSAKQWLTLRPSQVAAINTWDVDAKRGARPPEGTTHVVLDTPAQLDDKRIAEMVRVADKILVPVGPSMFDILATNEFLKSLRAAFTNGKVFDKTVGLVGMRVDTRTRAAEELARFVKSSGVPVAGFLRDTQNYVQLAAHGLTLFDVPAAQVKQDRASWSSIVQWVTKH
jgi:chromosome partitioning protein